MTDMKLLAFAKAAENKNISQAAKGLGYTQSAVSKMLAELEKEWKIPLFTRKRNGIVLTPEGRAMLPSIREVLLAYENLDLAVSELHGMESGSLRIGTFTSLSANALPMLLKAFRERYPNIHISCLNGEYLDIIEWMEDGMIDCGFLSLPAPPEFDAFPLFRDSFVAVVPKDHPLAKEPCVILKDIENETYLRLNERKDFEVDKFLERHNIQPHSTIEVASDHSLLSMVENGLGISIVHSLLLAPNRYDIVRVPLDETEFREIGVVMRRTSTPPVITRHFVEFTQSYVKGDPFFINFI